MEVCTSSPPSVGLPRAKEYLTIRQTAERYPAFPQTTLRWWRFTSHTSGFRACTITVGGKVLIDVAKFEAWLDSNADVHKDMSQPSAAARYQRPGKAVATPTVKRRAVKRVAS